MKSGARCFTDAHINAARGFLERVAPVLGEPERARNGGGRIGAEPPLLAATLGSLADVAQECLSQARPAPAARCPHMRLPFPLQHAGHFEAAQFHNGKSS